MADDEWRYDAEEFEEGEPSRSGGDHSDDAEHETDDGTWRFSLSDLDRDEDRDLGLQAEIQAGTPSPENVFFVALGIALALLVVWQLFV